MYKRYSLKSVNFSRFPACFGALKSTIENTDVGLIKKYSRMALDTDPIDYLKSISNDDLPITFIFNQSETTISIEFNSYWTVFEVRIEEMSEKEAKDIHQLIQGSLQLTKPTTKDSRGVSSLPSIMQGVWKVYDICQDIYNRLDIFVSETSEITKCFVSFRFNDHSKALAFELKEFMELVNIEFVSGLGFEPRSVSEKVIDRLNEKIDVFIVIQSSLGDSAWLNQEIGIARARNLPIIVLQEENSDTNPGILGDIEYIPFPENTISKAFVSILQAFSSPSIRHKGIIK